MEAQLLETIEKIIKNNNIQNIESSHQNNISRNLRNDEYLTRLLLRFHEDIPYTKIYNFVKRNQQFKELIIKYEEEIILNYLKEFKKHIKEEEHELLELEEIFRQSIVNNLVYLGINKISIEKCLEENLDLWFDECIDHSFELLFNYEEESEQQKLHKLYFTKMKKYIYYQRHKYIVELYGTITPEMLMTENEAIELQQKMLEINEKNLTLKK
jgi:hypothetical protein